MSKGGTKDLDSLCLQIVGKTVTRGSLFFLGSQVLTEVYIYGRPLCSYALGEE